MQNRQLIFSPKIPYDLVAESFDFAQDKLREATAPYLQFPVWCLYCTELEPISKTNDSDKTPRTGEYASNPERKNTPCISDLAGVKFLLKKERVFFFHGSALQVFGQCVGLQCGRSFGKTIFWGGKDLPKLRLICF